MKRRTRRDTVVSTETLELRALLATANFAAGTLTITTNANNDNVGLTVIGGNIWMNNAPIFGQDNLLPLANVSTLLISQQDPAAAQASTYDQFMAYTGPFEINGDRIRHFVEVSSLEAWTGTIQERWYKISGDRLELLTAALSVGNDAPVGRLAWTRVERAVFPT